MSETQTTGPYVAVPGVETSLIGVVLGNYRVTAALSTGGMGSLYRAWHELLDRPAVIKLLRPELTENEELVQRFFTEAKAATSIRHPGIVEVYDFGYTDDGHAYYVMEFLDGVPLSRAIAERGRFAELEAASIARSIASALKAAHAKGIIHRDLKPDNVFLVPDPDGREPRVKVLDFGIAKLANPPPTDQRRTRAGVLLGTPKYMAPEQAREAAGTDARADLYSLGCILYEMLCGQPPFVAEGAGEIIAMQLFAEPEPVSKLAPVAPELEAIVTRLLDKEPANRFQTARELMDALVAIGVRISASRVAMLDSGARDIARSDTLPAMPVPSVELAVPAPKRSWRWPLVLGGAALAAIAATITVIATRERAPAAAVVEPAPDAAPAPAPVVATPAQAPVAEPAPAVAEPPPVVADPAPAKVPGPPVKKRRPVQRATTAPIDATPAPTAPPKPPKPTTQLGSPIEDKL